VRDTTLNVAGERFHIRLWSAGDGPPLLYLHGIDGHPGDAPYLGRLAERHRVYAPEHPGFGESTGIEQIDDIIDMVLYYRELVATLGITELDLVGHSLGGMFAAELAVFCPWLVRRLVLVAPFGLWLEEAQIPDLFAMSPGQLQRATWHDPEPPAAQQSVTAGTNGMPPIATMVTRAGNLAAAGKFLWPIPDRGLAKRLRHIQAPTLVVLGESDKLITRPYGAAFIAAIAQAQLVTIAEAGHAPMLEQPDAFLSAVEDFLRG
jgi:pimeloyl-ACP methyl ester carboxylesterase